MCGEHMHQEGDNWRVTYVDQGAGWHISLEPIDEITSRRLGRPGSVSDRARNFTEINIIRIENIVIRNDVFYTRNG